MKDATARCSMCNNATIKSLTSRSNTTNLTKHIEEKHADTENGKNLKKAISNRRGETKAKLAKKDMENNKISTLLSFIKRQASMPKKGKEEIVQIIAKAFICSNSHFSEIEE